MLHLRRSALSLSSLGAAAFLASLVYSPNASAQACDPSTLLCSVDTIQPHVEGNERLPNPFDTGWLPKCNPATPDGHCDAEDLQITARMAFDPIGGGESATPLFKVEMPKEATLQAEWPTTDYFEISLKPATTAAGKFTVTHTITPEFGLFMNLSVIGLGKTEVVIDATDLVNLLPGAKFNYTASGTTSFKPWAFDPVMVNVAGKDLANSQLFAITFQQLGELVGSGSFQDVITGSFSFNATTDTDFVYQTTLIDVIGGLDVIDSETATTRIPMVDANYLEFTVVPQGTLTYTGTLGMKPVINVSSVAGIPISLHFPINVGLDFPYQSDPLKVTFPTEIVHIPLPNVFVPSSFVDFGAVDTGNKTDKKIVIDNTGELGATLEFSSSDPQFTTGGVTSTQVGPEQTYDLSVSFRPTKPGQQKATITVKSNDPDSPEQTFEVIGYGQGDPLPEDPGNSGGAGGGGGFTPTGGNTTEDSGCGCRIPQGTNGSSAAGLLAMAGLAMLRRRRKQSKRA
ncbi:MAG: choice-of-anchor D domain-containing protein [Polyangiaceae bacterium]|nr:choice-of-anchor D domain-containing protein [Polyangiaceae bacterium]MCB9609187.1 choice-of-anchor D domain-containing protein [Polyangiaceae bacterium]